MSLDKARLKIEILHDLGCSFDDVLEKYEQDIQRSIGSTAGLNRGSHDVAALLKHIDQDVEEGSLSAEAAEAARLYVGRASVVCHNLMNKAENDAMICTGRKDGMKKALDLTRSAIDTEMIKAQRLLSDMEESDAINP